MVVVVFLDGLFAERPRR